jgi:hypothetical protein
MSTPENNQQTESLNSYADVWGELAEELGVKAPGRICDIYPDAVSGQIMIKEVGEPIKHLQQLILLGSVPFRGAERRVSLINIGLASAIGSTALKDISREFKEKQTQPEVVLPVLKLTRVINAKMGKELKKNPNTDNLVEIWRRANVFRTYSIKPDRR